MNSDRNLFHLPEGLHYLNNAYKAPLLKSAEEAGIAALRRARNPSGRTADDFFDEVEMVHALFAEIVGTKAENIASIPSVSYGMSNALNNIPSEPGKKALIIAREFPSDYMTLRRWAKDRHCELVISDNPPDEDWNEALLDQIDQSVSLVMLSTVHWMNGYVYDLQRIGNRCSEVGAYLVVDGTQSVGALPIDVETCKIDALVCAAYKWLFGPYSTGLAYYSPRLHSGRPIEESWMNRTNAKEFSKLADYGEIYKPGAARYNVGEVSNFILTPMLHAALKQVILWDADHIQDHCKALGNLLQDYLNKYDLEISPFSSAHLFQLPLPTGHRHDLLADVLRQNKIQLSVRGDGLRVSLHVYNGPEDIEALVRAVDSIIL